MAFSSRWEKVGIKEWYELVHPSFTLRFSYQSDKNNYAVSFADTIGTSVSFIYYPGTDQVCAYRRDRSICRHKRAINASKGLPENHLKTLQSIIDKIECRDVELFDDVDRKILTEMHSQKKHQVIPHSRRPAKES